MLVITYFLSKVSISLNCANTDVTCIRDSQKRKGHSRTKENKPFKEALKQRLLTIQYRD